MNGMLLYAAGVTVMAGAGLAVAGAVALVRPAVRIAGRWWRWQQATGKARAIVAKRAAAAGGVVLFAMAPIYKHGGHFYPLDLPALGAGAASDTSTLLTYHGEAASILGTIDRALEAVKSAVLTFDGNVTGAATNFFQIDVKHYSVAGVLKNQISYAFQNTINATAFVPIDLSGPVAGALTNPTGKTILFDNWTLLPGDSIVVKRTSAGTGLASPAFTVTLDIGTVGS